MWRPNARKATISSPERPAISTPPLPHREPHTRAKRKKKTENLWHHVHHHGDPRPYRRNHPHHHGQSQLPPSPAPTSTAVLCLPASKLTPALTVHIPPPFATAAPSSRTSPLTSTVSVFLMHQPRFSISYDKSEIEEKYQAEVCEHVKKSIRRRRSVLPGLDAPHVGYHP